MARRMHAKRDMKRRISLFIVLFVSTAGLAACGAGIIPLGGGIGTPTLSGSSGDETALLTWTQVPEANEYVLNRDGSEIQRTPDLTYQDTGLTNGREYRYTVSALSGDLEGDDSNEVALIPVGTPVPTAVSRSLAVTVEWERVSGAVQYNLYAQNVDSGGDYALIATLNETGAPTLAYDHTGLSNCEDWLYMVRAVNGLGQEGADSEEALGEPDTEGVLDPDFGGGGYVGFGTSGWFADVAVMDDGTILGLRDMAATDALTAYDEDGNITWEVLFDGPGPAVDHDMDEVHAVVVDSQGRILVAGRDAGRAKICRLIPSAGGYDFDDAGFGDGTITGCAQLNSNPSTARDIAFDSQDRIVVAGYVTVATDQITVWVVISDGINAGQRDSSFNSSGEYVYTALITQLGYATATVFNGTYQRIYVVGRQITPDGAIIFELIDDDPPNVPAVNASIDANADGGARGIAHLGDGDLLIAGHRESVPELIYAWRRSNLGAPFVYDYGAAVDVRGLDVDCRARGVIAGRADAGLYYQMMLMRTEDDFEDVDGDFAALGWFIDTAPEGGLAHSVAHDRVGRLIVAGQVDTGVTMYPRLWRLR